MDTCTPAVRLRLTNREASSPRQTDDYLIPAEGCITQIFKTDERNAGCRSQTDDNQRANGLLARIHRDKWSIILEPLIEDVTVDAPFFRRVSKAWNSTSVNVARKPYYPGATYVFLRPDDTINFPGQHISVAIAFADENTHRSNAHPNATDESMTLNEDSTKPEVQVKSSNVEQAETYGENAFDSSEDEDEDDLDLPTAARVQTPGDLERTPAKSRQTELAVKETPKHSEAVDSAPNENDQVYSTARDVLSNDNRAAVEDDQHSVVGTESPSLLAQKRSHVGVSQAGAGLNLLDKVDSTTSNELEEPAISSAKKVRKTYSRSNRTRNILERSIGDSDKLATSELADTDPEGPLEALEGNDDAEADIEAEQDIITTSDAMNERDVAVEAVRRSMSQGSSKRKAPDEDGEDEKNTPTSSKKQKMNEVSANIEMLNAKDHETVDVVAQSDGSAPSRTLGKLKRPAPCLTQESGEEIAVATKKSSPEVVIRQRRPSGTPRSSTSISSLTGKIPKILLSSESEVQKDAAMRKWLKKTGAAIIENVPSKRAHFVCVVTKDHSLKSAKVLHSLAMGKLVITDDWLTDSRDADELLDPADFIHKALEPDITHDRSRIFSGKHLFFTSLLISKYKNGWNDIQAVAKEAGAVEVDKVPFHRYTYLQDQDDVVFFGWDKEDNEVSSLIKDYDRAVYSKDLFTHSIITGQLERDRDDYKLTSTAPVNKGRRSL